MCPASNSRSCQWVSNNRFQVRGPILAYLQRIFALLEAEETEELLQKNGDGVKKLEKQASGWNKFLNTLLTSIRSRVTAGTETASTSAGGSAAFGDEPNWLATNEQLLLFRYCQSEAKFREELSNSNGSLLADLMESKCVDFLHVGGLVSFVLSNNVLPQTVSHRMVRDSALRAMVRLPADDRDAMIATLLKTDGKLPLQVLFSLSVAELRVAGLIEGVVRQLRLLVEKEWEELENLIRDANPTREEYVHTFPRAPEIQAAFGPKFLARYLRGDNPQALLGPYTTQGIGGGESASRTTQFDLYEMSRVRDARFFRLFAICTDLKLLPALLLNVLDRQLHPFPDGLFLKQFENSFDKVPGCLTVAVFENLLEHFPATTLSQYAGSWICRRIALSDLTGEKPSTTPADLVTSLLSLIKRSSYTRSQRDAVLLSVIRWGEHEKGEISASRTAKAGALLKMARVQELVQKSLEEGTPRSKDDVAKAKGKEEKFSVSASLWITFFEHVWRNDELDQTDDKNLNEDLLDAGASKKSFSVARVQTSPLLHLYEE